METDSFGEKLKGDEKKCSLNCHVYVYWYFADSFIQSISFKEIS